MTSLPGAGGGHTADSAKVRDEEHLFTDEEILNMVAKLQEVARSSDLLIGYERLMNERDIAANKDDPEWMADV